MVMVCTTPSTPPTTPSASAAILWVSTPKLDAPRVLQDKRADCWETTGVIATQDWAGRAARSYAMELEPSSAAPHAAANRITTLNDFMGPPMKLRRLGAD